MDVPFTEENREQNKEKLWNSNFLLLLQGQLVSRLGDVIYIIALGFWVINATGSSSLMGTIMAVTIAPRVIFSPFAGVIVDRWDRKWLLVSMDVIRGAIIVCMGIAAFKGLINIWILFAAQIIIGICDAVYNPAVSSIVPDIVPKSRLMNANSLFNIIQQGSIIVGNIIGGIVFQLFGAPLMFLFNGFSFLLSGIFQLLLKIPRVVRTGENIQFFKEVQEGYRFMLQFKGLRYLILLTALTSFIICIVMVLLIPLFNQEEFLGPARYGIFLAFLAGGFLVGGLFTTFAKIPPEKRMIVFMTSVILSNVSFMLSTWKEIFTLMVMFVFLGGVFTAILEVMLFTTVQYIVPQDKRGTVFALLGMIAEILVPLGMVLGGFLGEIISIRLIIFFCFLTQLLVYLPFGFIEYFKDFINFDPDKDIAESIIVNRNA